MKKQMTLSDYLQLIEKLSLYESGDITVLDGVEFPELPVDSALQYNRARQFDPTVGRWLSQEPLAFDDGEDHKYPYFKTDN